MDKGKIIDHHLQGLTILCEKSETILEKRGNCGEIIYSEDLNEFIIEEDITKKKIITKDKKNKGRKRLKKQK